MIEKGGESMSLEAMKQVTEAEEANRARRAEAQAEAKRLVAEAERAGKACLAEARAQAEAQARELMRQAEAKAAEHASEVMAQTRKSCDALRRPRRRPNGWWPRRNGRGRPAWRRPAPRQRPRRGS